MIERRETEAVLEAEEADFRRQTYNLLHLVRQPSKQEEEALEGIGIIFLLLETKSLENHSWWGRLNYVIAKMQFRDHALPVAVKAGFNPTRLALPNSFGKSRLVQLQMIEHYSQQLQLKCPYARAVMLPSTGYAQADRAYKAGVGGVLFRNYFTRTLDNVSWYAGYAGRDDPSGQFKVYGWPGKYGDPIVGAVPAIVFVGKR